MNGCCMDVAVYPKWNINEYLLFILERKNMFISWVVKCQFDLLYIIYVLGQRCGILIDFLVVILNFNISGVLVTWIMVLDYIAFKTNSRMLNIIISKLFSSMK